MAEVSIVVPVYNQVEFLGDCLQSFVDQGFSHWEAIVVDDASTQGDAERVAHELGDARIRFVRHPQNRGLGAARNTGFRLAQSQLVLPVDADDMLHPTFLEKVGSAMLERPDADCAFADLQLFGASHEVWHYKMCDTATMLVRQWIPGAGTLMQRSLWARIGGYCEAPEILGNEDWDFWLAAVTIGIQAVHVPEVLYLYRRHEASMEARLKYEDFQHREFLYRRHRALFDRYHAGPAFLAAGYARSASASHEKGERLRAFELALKSVTLSPTWTAAKLLAWLVSPSWLVAGWRRCKGRLRSIAFYS